MFLFALLFCACKDAFTPQVDAKYKNLLVVEGFISIGTSTTIKLSRTGDLQDWQVTVPEKNAEVTITGNKGTLLNGFSGEDGQCVLNTENLSLEENYMLSIKLADGKTYQTAYLDGKASPKIDSLNFAVESKGFQVYIHTHDNSGNTRYYKWDYQETWEIRSPFPSSVEYKNGKVVTRDPNINIQYCWSTSKSSHILLETTERLTEDKVTFFPLIHIIGNSVKVAYMYSILVNQYGLTPEAYQYLVNMRKNTEQIGSIFDSQPSELQGNIVCTSNPGEQVIGWVSAGTVSQKRLFISYKDKPAASYDWVYRQSCEAFISSQDSLLYYLGGNKLIIDEQLRDGKVKYSMSSRECIDCRLRGSNIKPDYWPN
ncbi:hypothetical protein BCY91_10935 [Pelobium manganitolerans]|uniref:DUF4249 domain-containing protein n=2 Tax=Pelobium manganitolerans TaxID=1842495 RepID=A0A419S2U6_9SPHI|nr:hypothetical protein BCY91_10935 [Pelobium manganitolerans]